MFIGVIKICSLVLREFLSLGCIISKILCAHHQEDFLDEHSKSAGAGRSVAAGAPDTCCLLLFLDFLSQMCQGMESIGVSLL